MSDKLPEPGLPIIPAKKDEDGPCRILLLSEESAWSSDFKVVAKRMGFRVKRLESTVETLVHIHEFDPHVLLVHHFRTDGLTLVDLCDAIRVPRLLRPLALLVTTDVAVPPSEDFAELGIDEIFETGAPIETSATSVMQHFRLTLSQRQVLEREREILDSLPDALIVLGHDLTLWKINRSFAEMLGAADVTELRRHLGEPLAYALQSVPGVPVEDGTGLTLSNAVDLALRTGKSTFETNIVLCRNERTIAGQITELPGNDKHVLVTLRDVTEREQHLMREARRERLATIGNLAVGVAHEIQNPNTFSRVNAANLKTIFKALTPLLTDLTHSDPNTKIGAINLSEMIDRIESAISGVEKASDRIGAVLATLKSYGQNSSDSIGEVTIRAVVEEAELLTKHLVRGKAKLAVDIPDTVPAVKASSSELSQVFINLIENAVQAFSSKSAQARGDGEAEIRIHIEQISDETVIVAVTDNGPGIDESVQTQIFRPYFTTKAQGVGTGLGLSLSSDIVRRFGGDLTVRSRKGAGASFLISLRRAAVPESVHS